MKIGRPMLKLPRQYCAETLASEITALPASAWLPHPGRIVGNDAVPLVTPGGVIGNGFTGPMAPTQHLLQCRYIQEIMSDIGAVWGRSRLMGLAARAVVPVHVDVGHYWRTHFRIHIPVITNAKVAFTCEGQTENMAAGECWIFDSFRIHNVRNDGTEKRVHLVLDTVGGEGLWDLMRAAEQIEPIAPVTIAPGTIKFDRLAYEQINTPQIMSVWELRCHIDFLLPQAPESENLSIIRSRLDRFALAWGAIWAEQGANIEAVHEYQRLIANIRADLRVNFADRIVLPNGVPLDRALNELIFMVAVPDDPRQLAAA